MRFGGDQPVELTVPVVPRDTVPGADEPCDSCGSNRTTRARQVVEGIDLVLCLDEHSCVVRYRAGLTPAEYADALRGDAPEIIGVAP